MYREDALDGVIGAFYQASLAPAGLLWRCAMIRPVRLGGTLAGVAGIGHRVRPGSPHSDAGKVSGALFSLSLTEAKLAEALVLGLSPGDYATRAGISLSTVRTQLRSMFEKTLTRRQTEPVKLLASLPAVRVDWEGD